MTRRAQPPPSLVNQRLLLFLLAALLSRLVRDLVAAKRSGYNGSMQKAAKEKMFFLVLIASALFTCAPSIASSAHTSTLENRIELFLLEAQNCTGQHALDAAKHVENYDSLQAIALESSVAPKILLGSLVALMPINMLHRPRHPMLIQWAGLKESPLSQEQFLIPATKTVGQFRWRNS